MIEPSSIAFDIDGVVADIVTLFIDIANQEYSIKGIEYNDFKTFNIDECFDIKLEIINEIIDKIVCGNYSVPLKAIKGAGEVLRKLCKKSESVLFVTARPSTYPIHDWLIEQLYLEASSIKVVATGSFEGKTDILLEKNISYFVEDRLETCFFLQKTGIKPVLFSQPWNRKNHPFIEVANWSELEALINFDRH